MVNSAPGFIEQPSVINGFSDLILSCTGPRWATTRARRSASRSCRSGSPSRSRPRLPSIDEIRAAARRIEGTVVRTPLVRLQHDGDAEIYLKLENLQPIGSFKLRGAGNALALADPDELAAGRLDGERRQHGPGRRLWHARERGLPARSSFPRRHHETKLDAIERLGGAVVKVPVSCLVGNVPHAVVPGNEGALPPRLHGPGSHGRKRDDRARDRRGPP